MDYSFIDNCSIYQNLNFENRQYAELCSVSNEQLKPKVFNGLNTESEEKVLAKSYLNALILTNAIKIATDPEHAFTLRNGSSSMIYMDHAAILCQNESYDPFIKALNKKLDLFSSTSVLINVDSKSSPQIVGALAFISKLRQIAVNSPEISIAEKGLNIQMRYPKNILPSDTYLVIDDVYTKNDKTAINVISRVKSELAKNKINVPLKFYILVGLNRSNQQQVKSNEGELIDIYSVLTMRDIFFEIKDILTDSQKHALFEEFGQEASLLLTTD